METIKKMFMSICLSILIVNMFLVLAMVGIMTGVHALFWFFGWAVVGSSAVTIALAVWTLIEIHREVERQAFNLAANAAMRAMRRMRDAN